MRSPAELPLHVDPLTSDHTYSSKVNFEMKEGRNRNEASEMRESEGEKEDEIIASEDRDMPGTDDPGSTGRGVCINRQHNQETDVKKLRKELENQ
ncbi:hypothetical protein AMECASPLE_039696 [Ameca splendens]|uniref:Uncharacterized protein n=1 Tax=Ameca splendens TaxID=208324 RepID=A0ABV0XLL0_9TELE